MNSPDALSVEFKFWITLKFLSIFENIEINIHIVRENKLTSWWRVILFSRTIYDSKRVCARSKACVRLFRKIVFYIYFIKIDIYIRWQSRSSECLIDSRFRLGTDTKVIYTRFLAIFARTPPLHRKYPRNRLISNLYRCIRWCQKISDNVRAL